MGGTICLQVKTLTCPALSRPVMSSYFVHDMPACDGKVKKINKPFFSYISSQAQWLLLTTYW